MRKSAVKAISVLSAAFMMITFLPVPPANAYMAEKYFKNHMGYDNEEEKYMFGGWDGKREELEHKGVTFQGTFTCDILGNPVGGYEQGARYDHSMGWDVNFDLEKFAGMKGTQFHISGLWRAGQNLSSATINNALVASSIYGHEQFRLYGLYLEQDLFEKKLNIRIGRLGTGDDFASSPLYWTYVSNAVDGNPISIPINLFFPTYPTAVWGARAKVNYTKEFYSLTGIYNGDDRVQRDSAYGLDFSMRLKKGVAFAQEFCYAPNTAKEAEGLPGHYKAGIYYHGGTFRDLYSDINGNSAALTNLDRQKHIGNYNIYFHADQMVYREHGPGTDQGLIPLAAAAIGPSNMNQFPFFIMGGLIYKGVVPGRDDDTTAFEVVYTKYSEDITHSEFVDQQKYEMMLEFTHKVMITPWMFLQPDIQYIINPKGGNNLKDALVIGTRFGVTF